jgi:hypothetical protein
MRVVGSGKWNRFCTDGLLDGLGHPVSDFRGDFRIVQIRVGGDGPVDGRAAGRFSKKKFLVNALAYSHLLVV